MAINELREYKRITDWLHTAGQPNKSQLEALADYKIQHVVNLALPTSDNAETNEAKVLGELGVNYLNIPVDFEKPLASQLALFCSFLDSVKGEQTLVHCAYNMRVSAFVFLYRVKSLKTPLADAEESLHALWKPYGVWEEFVREALNS